MKVDGKMINQKDMESKTGETEIFIKDNLKMD
jgi:hypothetical protein